MADFISDASLQDIRRHIHHICRGIQFKKTRACAEQELCEHVEDHIYRLILRGVSEEQAVRQALDALGDPETLCHAMCAVHNRIPPDLGRTLLCLLGRVFAAYFVHCLLWAFGLSESHPLVEVIPFLIVFGLSPVRYLRALVLRIKQVGRIRRTCRARGFSIRQSASPILSVFIPARRPEWQIDTPAATYCIHFLAVHHRRATLCLHDSFAYSLITTYGSGARFIDRAPRRFNSLRTADQSYEQQCLHHLHFPVSTDIPAARIQRILLLNPVPSEIRYRKDTTDEYVGNGDRLFGLTLYDAPSLIRLLQEVEPHS